MVFKGDSRKIEFADREVRDILCVYSPVTDRVYFYGVKHYLTYVKKVEAQGNQWVLIGNAVCEGDVFTEWVGKTKGCLEKIEKEFNVTIKNHDSILQEIKKG